MTLLEWMLVGGWLIAVTAGVAAALTAAARRLSRRWGFYARPHPNGQHRLPVPLLGGGALAASFAIVVWGHLLAMGALANHPALMELVPADLQGPLRYFGPPWFQIGVIFTGAILMFLVGLWDDVRGLSIRARIYPELVIAIGMVACGVRAELGILPSWAGFAVSVVWLVGIANAFNLIDGADGLAAGLAAMSAVFLGVILLLGGHPMTASFLFALAGACLGFLAFNWHPASIFMGSSGTLFLGTVLGASTLVAAFMSPETVWLFPMLIPALVFAVPLYDTASVVLTRLRLKRSIFEGDRSHFHHRLMRIGFSHRQTVAFMYVVSAAFGAAALLISRTSLVPNLVILFQAVVLVCLIVLMERVVNRGVEAKRAGEKPRPVEPAREPELDAARR